MSAVRERSLVDALRVVALLESLSFAVLLVGSVLKRTTGPDLVPVLGPVHGALFVALVLLVLACLPRLRWAPVRTTWPGLGPATRVLVRSSW